MNIIHKLTWRHLKKNKRRTLVTIIGVIISAAMITAVSTLGVSFLDILARQDISKNGEWHVEYKDIDANQFEAIKEDGETKSLMLSTSAFAELDTTEKQSKPYLFIKSFNEAGLQNFPTTINEGRFPIEENELVIPKGVESLDYQIGDEVELEIGHRWDPVEERTLENSDFIKSDDNRILEELKKVETKTYTIVGLMESPTWEPSWAPSYTAISFVDEEALTEDKIFPVDALIIANSIKTSIFDHSLELAETNEIGTVNFNSDLLRYYGVTANDSLRTTLYSLMAIIMAVIILGSVALIYNAFAISVSERARHLGMLASVGATKKQKRNSVFFEGAIIGAFSIPIGILAGLAGIGVTFAYINTIIEEALGITEKFELVVTPASIIVTCFIAILTIFISTYIPAQRASKISAIDAIRQSHDIKLSGKTVKTSKLVRKIFGIEAEIGLKNTKRNRKRYLATLLSLIISIILFLSVSFFTDSLKQSLQMSQSNAQHDIMVYDSQLSKEDAIAISELEHVTDFTITEELHLSTLLEVDKIAERLRQEMEMYDVPLEDGKYWYTAIVQSIDNASFIEYTKEIGMEAEDFINDDTTLGIVINEIDHRSASEGTISRIKAIETGVGDTIELFTDEAYGELTEDGPIDILSTIEIAAQTDKVPMGIQESYLGGVTIIIPQSKMDGITHEKDRVVYLNSADPLATEEAIHARNDMNINLFNSYQHRQQEEQMILLLSIFVYGFITLISLISIANIFNTISTSISLRSREFAMLRSIGMTPKGFNKMIYYESIFYGVKALLYGIPISILIMYGIYRANTQTFSYPFSLPWWSMLFVVVMIFIIVGAAMLYSIGKVKKENIIESLKQENI